MPGTSLPVCQGPAAEYTGPIWATVTSASILVPPFTVQVRTTKVPGNDTLVCTMNPPSEDDGVNPCYSQCDENGNCNNSTTCSCEWISEQVTYFDVASGVQVSLTNLTVMLPTYFLPSASNLGQGAPVLFYDNNGKLTYSCPDSCVVDCRQAKVRTTTPVASSGSSSASLPLSSAFNMLGGDTTCVLTTGGGFQVSVRFQAPRVGGCEFQQQSCPLCWTTWSNWNCYSPLQKGAMIGAALLLALLCLSILPIALRGLFLLLKLATFPLWGPVLFIVRFRRTRAANTFRQGFRRTANTFSYYFLSPSDEEPSEDEILPFSTPSFPNQANFSTAQQGEVIYASRGGGRFVLRNNLMVPVLLIACFCVASGLACDTTGQVLNPIVPYCAQVGSGLTTCEATYAIGVTLPALGSISCTSVRDNDNYQIGTVQVQLLEVITTMSLTTAYYTANWSPQGACTLYCGGSGACLPATCGNFNGVTNPGYLIPDQTLLNHPGFTSCHVTSTGCTGCGAAYCCGYCRYDIITSGDLYEVLTPGNQQTTALLQVNVTFNGSSTVTSTTVSLDSTGVQLGTYYQLTLGAPITANTNFTQSVVQDTTTSQAWYAPANPLGTLTPGAIGDIQGGSVAAFTTCAGTTCYQFSTAAVTVTSSAVHETWAPTKPPGITTLPQYPTLPMIQATQVVSLASNTLTVNLTTLSQPIILNITTTGAITYQRQIGVVCPQASIVGKASGCWNCAPGASVTLLAHSSCTGGYVSLSAPSGINLTTVALLLTILPANYTVYFSTDVQNNNFVLTLSADALHTTTVAVQFVASELSTVGNGTAGASTALVAFFEVWENDLAIGLAAAAIAVGVVVALILFRPCLCCCCCCRRGAKVKHS